MQISFGAPAPISSALIPIPIWGRSSSLGLAEQERIHYSSSTELAISANPDFGASEQSRQLQLELSSEASSNFVCVSESWLSRLLAGKLAGWLSLWDSHAIDSRQANSRELVIRLARNLIQEARSAGEPHPVGAASSLRPRLSLAPIERLPSGPPSS